MSSLSHDITLGWHWLTVCVILSISAVYSAPCESNQLLTWRTFPVVHNISWPLSTICSAPDKCYKDIVVDSSQTLYTCPLYIQPGDSIQFSNFNNTITTQVTYSQWMSCNLMSNATDITTFTFINVTSYFTVQSAEMGDSSNMSQQCSDGYRMEVTVVPYSCSDPGTDPDTDLVCMGNGVCSWMNNGVAETFHCSCDHGYTGDFCQEFDACISVSSCLNGATCVDTIAGATNDSHICLCSAGYTGEHCGIATDFCLSSPCEAGSCVQNSSGYTCICPPGKVGVSCELQATCQDNPCINSVSCLDLPEAVGTRLVSCECLLGYSGDYCEVNTDECISDPCVHGLCEDRDNGYKCFCSNGYKGDNCDVDHDDCKDLPCYNGATCADDVANFTCKCADGFSGRLCDINLDDCINNTCLTDGPNAVCVDGINEYTCQCPAGYTGESCNEDIDDCLSSPCAHESTCIDQVGGFTCNCEFPYVGDTCEQVPCDLYPCLNGGSCTTIYVEPAYSCTCPTGFVGNKCEVNIDECLLAGGDTAPCSEQGLCVDVINGFDCLCVPGWTGPICNRRVDDCIENECKNNSTCVDGLYTYTCACEMGWTGSLCEVEVNECYLLEPCQNGGVCIDMLNDYQCECANGWHGKNCTEEINECLTSNGCLNGGTCIDLIDDYSCQCPPFYTGSLCETFYEPCSVEYDQCRYNSSCQQFSNGTFICHCANGFTGRLCEQNINECASSPCVNSESCEDLVDGFRCLCSPGYTGSRCEEEINECLSAPCLNGGSCMDEVNRFSCLCTDEYTGVTCQDRYNKCSSSTESNVCSNGGTCFNISEGFYCVCADGYEGLTCDININECLSNPCGENSECVDEVNSYRCDCDAGYAGRLCDYNVNDCINVNCGNGSCEDLVDDFLCACSPGFTGEFCSIELNECDSNPCLNNATCTDLIGWYSCMCSQGFSGDRCEVDESVCTTSTCLNSGTCVESIGITFSCQCQPGYTGSRCQLAVNECLSSPCVNALLCLDGQNNYTCVCKDGWTGHRCDLDVNECDSSPCLRNGACREKNDSAGFICYCPPGFGGDICDREYDDCDQSSCLNGGTCVDGVNGFTCNCPEGTSGVVCQIIELPSLTKTQSTTISSSDGTTTSTGISTSHTIVQPISESTTQRSPSTAEVSSDMESSSISTSTVVSSTVSTSSSAPISEVKSTAVSESTTTKSLTTAIHSNEASTTSTTPLTHITGRSTTIGVTQHASSPPSKSTAPISTTATALHSTTYSTETAHIFSTKTATVVDSFTPTTSVRNSSAITITTPIHTVTNLTHAMQNSSLSVATQPSSFSTSPTHTSSTEATRVIDTSTSTTTRNSSTTTTTMASIQVSTSAANATQSLSTTNRVPMQSSALPTSPTKMPPDITTVQIKPSTLRTNSTPISTTDASNSITDVTPVSTTVAIQVSTVPTRSTRGDSATTVTPIEATLHPTGVVNNSSTTTVAIVDSTLSTSAAQNSSLSTTAAMQASVSTPPSTIIESSAPTVEPLKSSTSQTKSTWISSSSTSAETSIKVSTSTTNKTRPSFESTTVAKQMSTQAENVTWNSSIATRAPTQSAVSPSNSMQTIASTNATTTAQASASVDVTMSSSAPTSMSTQPGSSLISSMQASSTNTTSITQVSTSSNRMQDFPSTTVEQVYESSATGISSVTITTPIQASTPLANVTQHTSTFTTAVKASTPVANETQSESTITTAKAQSSVSVTTIISNFSITAAATQAPTTPTNTTQILSTNLKSETQVSTLATTKIHNISATSTSPTLPSILTTNVSQGFTVPTTAGRQPSPLTANTTLRSSATATGAMQPSTLSSSISYNVSAPSTMMMPDSTLMTNVTRASSAPSSPSQVSTTNLANSTQTFSLSTTRATLLSTPTTNSVEASSTISTMPVSTPHTTVSQNFSSVTPNATVVPTVPLTDLTQTISTISQGSSRINTTSTTPATVSASGRFSVTTISTMPKGDTVTTGFSSPITPASASQSSVDKAKSSLPTRNATVTTTIQTNTSIRSHNTTQSVGDGSRGPTVPYSQTTTNLSVLLTSSTTKSTNMPSVNPTSERELTSSSIMPSVTSTTTSLSTASLSTTSPAEPPSSICNCVTCLNGGECVDVTSNGGGMFYECLCPLPYGGYRCEHELEIIYPLFKPSSAMFIDLLPSNQIEVLIAVSMTASGQLMALHSDSNNLLDVSVQRDGSIRVLSICDSEVMSSMQGYLDGGYHQLYIKLMTTESGTCNASVVVDSTDTVSSFQQINNSMSDLLTNSLRFGASNNNMNSFTGCVLSFTLNDEEMDLVKKTSDGKNIGSCSPVTCALNQCQNGAECVDDPDGWYCNCPPTHTGIYCEKTHCEVNPCLHGGTCIPTDAGFVCICALGRHGVDCSLSLFISQPYFPGEFYDYSSFLAYPKIWGIAGGSSFQIEFYVKDKASLNSSLILYTGKKGLLPGMGSDYLALSLEQGHVVFRYNLGSGEAVLRSASVLTAENYSSMVMVEFGHDKVDGYLTINDAVTVTNKSLGHLTNMNSESMLYVGSVDEEMVDLPTELPPYTQFIGCIYKLVYRPASGTTWREPGYPAGIYETGRNIQQCPNTECTASSCHNGATCIDLGSSFRCDCAEGWNGLLCDESSTANACLNVMQNCSSGSTCISRADSTYACLCPIGRAGLYCEQDMPISDPLFTGEESHMVLYGSDMRHTIDVEIEFKPDLLYGLLFYTAQRFSENSGDFLSISLHAGRVDVRVSFGGANLIVLTSEQSIFTGIWYTARVLYNGSAVSLMLDGSTYLSSVGEAASYSLLDTGDRVYLGGVPDLTRVNQAAQQGEPSTYEGCVRRLSVAGIDLPLTVQGAISGINVLDCDGTQCGHSVCRNGGTCIPGTTGNYACACEENFDGSNCELSMLCEDMCEADSLCLIHNTTHTYCLCAHNKYGPRCHMNLDIDAGFRLDGSAVSFLRLDSIPPSEDNSFQLSFSFTTQSDGLIVWAGHMNADYLAIGVSCGRVKVAYSYGYMSSNELVVGHIVVTENTWHSLYITSEYGYLTTSVDGIEYETQSTGFYMTLDLYGSLYIGNPGYGIDVKTTTDSLFKEGFNGCVKNVTINRTPLTNYQHYTSSHLSTCF